MAEPTQSTAHPLRQKGQLTTNGDLEIWKLLCELVLSPLSETTHTGFLKEKEAMKETEQLLRSWIRIKKKRRRREAKGRKESEQLLHSWILTKKKKRRREAYTEMNLMSGDWKTTVDVPRSFKISSTQPWSLTCEERFRDILSRVQDKNLARRMAFWLEWVDKVFPRLHSRTCFLPALNEDTIPVQGSDVRHNTAMQGMLACLQKMSEESREVFFCLSQFQFGQYVGKSCYAAAAAQIPESAGLSPEPPRDWKDGDMDFLLIHPRHGLVICEVKTFGDKQSKLNMTQEEVDDKIRAKLTLAVSQLDRAENTLTHLVSDVSPGLRIAKTIAFPNVTVHQVQQAIAGNPRLIQDLCQCLGTTDAADVTGLCLCSNQLSHPQTPCDVSENVLLEFGKWWQRRVIFQTNGQTHPDTYNALVARICGPAAAVTVPAQPWSNNLVRTTLSPKQIHLLNTAPDRVFLIGQSETGKVTTLLLMAGEWLRGGNDVIVIPSWTSFSLYWLLRQTVRTKLGSAPALGLVDCLWDYDFYFEWDVDEAANNLSNRAKEGLLYVIADADFRKYGYALFCTFCEKLLKKVPRLHLWAACKYDGRVPSGWERESLDSVLHRKCVSRAQFTFPPSQSEKTTACGKTLPSSQQSPLESTERVNQVAPTTLSPDVKMLSQSNVLRSTGDAPLTQMQELHQKGDATSSSACQQEDRKEDRSDECSANELDDGNCGMCTSLAYAYGRYSVSYKLKIELADALPLETPHASHSLAVDNENKTGHSIEHSGNIIPSPILIKNWDDLSCFSAEGGILRRQGSDVVLRVPPGAVQEKKNVTVSAAVCGNDAYIKQKLQLSATETVVSPLAEFWAGSNFRFQKHVHVTLPTCLSKEYDVRLVHIYCITRGGPEEKINFRKLERLDVLPQTSAKHTPDAYFYVNEKGQVQIMTTHFSGYVCTYCGLCQNIGLEVYSSHEHDNGSVQVSVIAHLWDKLHVPDFRKWNPNFNSYRMVLRGTFQLREMFKPAELHVSLTLSNEQQTIWQHTQFEHMPETTQRFALNWSKIKCENCTDIQAMKYTELGPFSASWMLNTQNGVTPSTVKACIVVSHLQLQGSLSPYSSRVPIHINVRSSADDERLAINIQNVRNLHIAQQHRTQENEKPAASFLTEGNVQ